MTKILVVVDMQNDFIDGALGTGQAQAIVAGVGQDVVDASAFSLEIPQYGTKHSLNVSVSVGIVLWHIVSRR